MAKHKKTRREKKVADQRHSLYHLETKTDQEEAKMSKKVETPSYKIQSSGNIIAVNYDYLKQDIRKILIVTSAIFVAQIVLYFILNRV